MVEDMVGEVWKWVPGYENIYEVSNTGRMRTWINYRRPLDTVFPIMLHPATSCGYPFATLTKNKKVVTSRVSRLVLAAFVGPAPSPRHHAAHNNGNILDNRVENLRWATPKENAADKLVHGTNNHGERHGNSKLTDAQTIEICGFKCKGVSGKSVASRFGITASLVNRIWTGERRSRVTGIQAVSQ